MAKNSRFSNRCAMTVPVAPLSSRKPVLPHLFSAAVLMTGAIASGQQVPRAVPVDEPAAPKAQPVEDTRPARLTGPDEDLYEYATLCYSQKDYAIAIEPLTQYIQLYPNGRHAAEARFRLAECYLKTNQLAQAQQKYNDVITFHPKTESAASAAYRLGAAAYNARDFLSAASYFDTAARITTSHEVKLAALYNSAIAYKQGGNEKSALAAFKAVSTIKTNNQYRETALLEVATAELAAGQKEEALKTFNDLAATTKDSNVQGDALLKAGLILNELGKGEEALKNFNRVLTFSGLPKEQRGMAMFGLIQGYYVNKEYDKVIQVYTENATTLPPGDLQVKMLLLVGNAQKQKQSYHQAIETFLLLEKNYPDSPEALEAGYQKLLSFYQLGDKDVPEFTQRFEDRYKGKYEDHEYVTMSRLIRADWYFGKGDYTDAADAYVGTIMDNIPEKLRASVLYKRGFAECEAGKYNEAINSLSTYITTYPKDGNIAVALAQRGLAYKFTRAFDRALEDFTNIVKNYSGEPALEMALYQSGTIKGDTRDFQGMIADLTALLDKFPKTAAAAEANFRIGKGYFDLNQKESFSKAIPPLRKSVELDSKTYLDKASQLLISCHWLLEDVDGMAKEIDAYLAARKDASISPKGLTFLGVNYFNRSDYKASARYLALACTFEQPEATDALVWNYLGRARTEIGEYAGAVVAFDHYLNRTPSGEGRVLALLGKGRAKLGLGEYTEATKCTDEGLTLIKEGGLKAQLQILAGDIAYAQGNSFATAGDRANAIDQWKTAAGNFVVVSQIFVDPQITPEAAWKAAEALEKLGETGKSDGLRKQLSSKYPDYKPKPPMPPAVASELPKAMPKPPPVEETPVEGTEPTEPMVAPADGDAASPAEPVPPKAEPVEDDEPAPVASDRL